MYAIGDLERARDEWRAFYEDAQAGGGADEDWFLHEFRRHMIDAADRNTKTNERRTELLRIARLWLFSVLWLTLFAGFLYVADQVLTLK